MQIVGNTRQFILRTIQPHDNKGVRQLIQKVMPEFGAVGPGFSIEDDELAAMAEAYSKERCRYFVVVDQTDRVVAGAGVHPLLGGAAQIAELRKMYSVREVRRQGLGRALMDACIDFARQAGFQQLYIESMSVMTQAQSLYQSYGFEFLQSPLGNSGHHGCDVYMALNL